MGINPWELSQIYGCDLYASATYMRRYTVILVGLIDVKSHTINQSHTADQPWLYAECYLGHDQGAVK